MTPDKKEKKTDNIYEYRKKYYLENKEKLIKKYKIKKTCKICGRHYSNYNLTKHINTKKHIKEIENLKNLLKERDEINEKINNRDKLIEEPKEIILDLK